MANPRVSVADMSAFDTDVCGTYQKFLLLVKLLL